MPGPIKPSEVQEKKNKALPEEVFQVFNDLIVENWDGQSATIKQDVAAERISTALRISTDEVFELGYLDVEAAFRKVRWKVEYDKPAYNESYEAFFVFSKK
jgi:hypothetical protein